MNNLTTSPVTVTLYKGATLTSLTSQAFMFTDVSLPAQSYLDWVGQARLDSGDFLMGGANLQQAVVINMEGEIGLS